MSKIDKRSRRSRVRPAFTSSSEKDLQNPDLHNLRAPTKQTRPGFTLIELMVVIAIIGMLASVVLASLSASQREARDQRRIADLKQLQKAFELYIGDHYNYPREAQGMNGDISTNETFQAELAPYLTGTPVDPAGIGNATYRYYYDGAHTCVATDYAVIFAKQMDKPENSNYASFLNDTCAGSLDGEGRGGGTESYNIILGPTNDF